MREEKLKTFWRGKTKKFSNNSKKNDNEILTNFQDKWKNFFFEDENNQRDTWEKDCKKTESETNLKKILSLKKKWMEFAIAALWTLQNRTLTRMEKKWRQEEEKIVFLFFVFIFLGLDVNEISDAIIHTTTLCSEL